MRRFVARSTWSTQPRLKTSGRARRVARLVRPSDRRPLSVDTRKEARKEPHLVKTDGLSERASKGGRGASEGRGGGDGGDGDGGGRKTEKGREERETENGGQASFSFPNRQIHLSFSPSDREDFSLSPVLLLLSTATATTALVCIPLAVRKTMPLSLLSRSISSFGVPLKYPPRRAAYLVVSIQPAVL